MTETCAKLGKDLKVTKFLMDPSYAHTNNGSFGCLPKEIFEKRLQLQYRMESATDKWYRYDTYDLWCRNLDALATFLNLPVPSSANENHHLVLCENATDAINAVLKSVSFESNDDCIIASQYTYPAILNAIDYASKYRRGENESIQVIKMPLVLPISNGDQLVAEYEAILDEVINKRKLNVRLIVADHISSATAIMYPIKKIIGAIRRLTAHTSHLENRKCLILVDGAHAIGQTNIELGSLDCDFYVSNLHKWFFSPRGSSFLYYKDEEYARKYLQPNYISWGYGKSVRENFFMRATNDKTRFYLVEDCIRFHNQTCGGLERIQAYCIDLLNKATRLLMDSWQTITFPVDESVRAPFMSLIRMPFMKNYQKSDSSYTNDELAAIGKRIMEDLVHKHQVIGLIVAIECQLYCRICSFVYNDLDDYVRLRDAISKLNE